MTTQLENRPPCAYPCAVYDDAAPCLFSRENKRP